MAKSLLASGRARDKYFASEASLSEQNAEFLSYREFLETLKVLSGTEATWPQFKQWFGRGYSAQKGLEAHQVYEEIRGVLCAQPGGVLSLARYLELGVRQSIYGPELRPQVYALFEKYQQFLRQENAFELSLAAHERELLASPRYDFIVIDEVQDLTIAQLNLVLKTLKNPAGFVLSGDSNQIVHPNFFSWSQVKSLFWQDPELAQRQQLSILRSNFRNANATTELANRILLLKHARFGSIDRESNYLIQPSSATLGTVHLLATDPTTLRTLNENTRQSTQFAVLVMRDEDKAAARQLFATPLLFSIQEAKGLEYEHIVLFRFVSDQRSAFAEIASDVAAEALTGDTLRYARAKDKSDKTLEILKFYINAFYVAITRALKNVYIVESDLQHPFLALLALQTPNTLEVSKQRSSIQDWQREAHRLEQQGKLEQADAIRRDVLKTQTPPWPVLGEKMFRELLVKTFRDQVPGTKSKQSLLDYAGSYISSVLARNEFASSYASNRALFFRVRHGGYAIHPQLQLRYQASQPWQPLVQMLNYPLLMESASNWYEIHRIAQQAGFEVPNCPVFAEREVAARSKALMEQQERLAHAERLREQSEQKLRQWQAQREQQAKNNRAKQKLRSHNKVHVHRCWPK